LEALSRCYLRCGFWAGRGARGMGGRRGARVVIRDLGELGKPLGVRE